MKRSDNRHHVTLNTILQLYHASYNRQTTILLPLYGPTCVSQHHHLMFTLYDN